MKKGYSIESDDVDVRYFCSAAESDLLGDKCRDRFEIIFAVSSLGSCMIEGNDYQLAQRSILLIPPLCFRSHSFNECGEFEGYLVSFKVSALSESVRMMLDNITLHEDVSGRFYQPAIVLDAISDIFRRYDDAFLLSGDERSAFLNTLVCETVIFLSAIEGRAISNSDNELGARVAKYLNSNIEKAISLDRLANKFFISKYHLCRAFKKYSGTSVHSYINHKRIMYAKQLIESGETASGAAERVGFGDYSAFYRAYVKIVGKSPSKE